MAITKWRYVRCTDDGCAIYECLNCYETWESRTAPGYNNWYLDLPCAVEGSFSYTSGDKEHHYIQRKEPEYTAYWHYCPVCGVKWEGATRTDGTVGPRRARIRAAMDRAKSPLRDPEYWWVLETRSGGHWHETAMIRAFIYPVKKVLEYKRQRDKSEQNCFWSDGEYESRLVIRKQVRSVYVRQIYL